MSSTNCCLTYINDPFRPANFSIDFDKTLVDTPGNLTINFAELLSQDFRIVTIQDRNDLRCTQIDADPTDTDHALIYHFNNTSTYWDYNLRSDSFTVELKNMVTGEVVAVTVTIRSVEIQDFDDPASGLFPADIDIDVHYPYPDQLRININQGWPNPATPPEYILYKTGYADPNYVRAAGVSAYSDHEMIIELETLASQSTPTSIPYFVAKVSQGPVDEATDVVGFANVNLSFQT